MKQVSLLIVFFFGSLCGVVPAMAAGTVPEEFFADSTQVGRKGWNKIEVLKYRAEDSVYVVIRFYTRKGRQWLLRNRYAFDKDGLTGCDVRLSDFNNDGCGDMTYVSNLAARSANEVRRLFVYDQKLDRLVYMKNSEDYPNLRYNRELHCIDAFLVYGGCSTVFLRVKGDRLQAFASVELMDGLTVRTYDGHGRERILLRDTTVEAGYVRYRNYRPLKEDEGD